MFAVYVDVSQFETYGVWCSSCQTEGHFHKCCVMANFRTRFWHHHVLWNYCRKHNTSAFVASIVLCSCSILVLLHSPLPDILFQQLVSEQLLLQPVSQTTALCADACESRFMFYEWLTALLTPANLFSPVEYLKKQHKGFPTALLSVCECSIRVWTTLWVFSILQLQK